MTNFVSIPSPSNVVKLSGTITNYRCNREYASFLHNQKDKDALGTYAIVAALTGSGGQAASAVGVASSMGETADRVEFDLDGASVRGWLWLSPFHEGDIVDVAAEWQGDHFQMYGASRPSDRTIAVYPHCSRSNGPHIKYTVKWCAICNAFFFGIFLGTPALSLGLEVLKEPAFFWFGGAGSLLLTFLCIGIANRYMPFVRLAERIFHILGCPEPAKVDLLTLSKTRRTEEDFPEFGLKYFRY